MRRLFLYGDLARTFPETVRSFVEAAGGSRARIGLLLMGGPGSERFLPGYRDPMRAFGAEVLAVAPDEGGSLPADLLDQLAACTGIFMGGGFPKRYRELYVESPVGNLIRRQYRAGVPYGGLSAGAVLATARCTLAGNLVEGPDNRYWVRAQIGDEPQALETGTGLGLLDDAVFDPHCAEWGSLPRLLAAMEEMGASRGAALDEPACIEIRNETELVVRGQGRVYLARRTGGPRSFALQVLEPGDVSPF